MRKVLTISVLILLLIEFYGCKKNSLNGMEIVFKGRVTEYLNNQPIAGVKFLVLRVEAASGNPVKTIGQVTTGENGEFYISHQETKSDGELKYYGLNILVDSNYFEHNLIIGNEYDSKELKSNSTIIVNPVYHQIGHLSFCYKKVSTQNTSYIKKIDIINIDNQILCRIDSSYVKYIISHPEILRKYHVFGGSNTFVQYQIVNNNILTEYCDTLFIPANCYKTDTISF